MNIKRKGKQWNGGQAVVFLNSFLKLFDKEWRGGNVCQRSHEI